MCRIATRTTWIEDNVLYLRMELLELWIELIFLWNYSKASKLEHTDLSIVLDIQYLTLLERILFLLVEFCNVELGLGTAVGTAWMLPAA